jgi:hypothetical protein
MIVKIFHHDFPAGPDALTHVADLNMPEGSDRETCLNMAYRFTQNIDGSWSMGERLPGGELNGDWCPRLTRIAPSHEREGKLYGLRSSMVGDVFELADGERWRVEARGFKPYVAGSGAARPF